MFDKKQKFHFLCSDTIDSKSAILSVHCRGPQMFLSHWSSLFVFVLCISSSACHCNILFTYRFWFSFYYQTFRKVSSSWISWFITKTTSAYDNVWLPAKMYSFNCNKICCQEIRTIILESARTSRCDIFNSRYKRIKKSQPYNN